MISRKRAEALNPCIDKVQVYNTAELYYVVCKLLAAFVKERGRSFQNISAARGAVEDALTAFDDNVAVPVERARERDPNIISMKEVFKS